MTTSVRTHDLKQDRAHARIPAPRPRSHLVGAVLLVGSLVGLTGLAACSPSGSTDNQGLPPGIQDPAVIKTRDGALGYYRSVVAGLPGIFDSLLVPYVGIMTDELTSLALSVNSAGPYTGLDSRTLTSANAEQAAPMYSALHKLRAQAREARGVVTTYLPDSTALAGQLYAVEGYAVTLLADLYCSGVPLSTVDFGADYTLATGSTTSELYQHAVAFFDSALTLASDGAHDSVQQLAAIGRGRALLALGRYDSAAIAVRAVPTPFRSELVASTAATSVLVSFSSASSAQYANGQPSVGDREGLNGLDYRSSGDPRTPAVILPGTVPDGFGQLVYFPVKYPSEGPTTYVLADGIEARLIEAEAALNGGSPAWLTTLNALRTDGTFDTQPDADDPSKTDTLWHAGTGGVAGLDTLSDPGNMDARVTLLFRERAFWLYLTAHRQGDLRRLIRQYHRSPSSVYPAGFYAGGNGQYGDDVTLPVPADEQRFNPHYTGCFNRNA